MKHTKPLGKRCWVVPDGFIPRITDADQNNRNGYLSHECICILNAGQTDAIVDLSVYFEDTPPKMIEGITVSAQRSRHLRMDELVINGSPAIERAKPYSMIVRSTEPIVVQMSRLDTTQDNMAFLSTMGFPIDQE